MLFLTETGFLEKLNNGKEIDCADIQNESHRDNKNISENQTLMNNDQKHPGIKDYTGYKTLGSNELFKSVSRARKASGKHSQLV